MSTHFRKCQLIATHISEQKKEKKIQILNKFYLQFFGGFNIIS